MKPFCRHILLLWITCSTGGLMGQGYVLKHYTSQNGLPNDEIFCFVQDDRGMLWIGTDNGLSSYDGQEFQSYSTSDGLPGTSITSLLIDDAGDMWVGAYRKGQSLKHPNGSNPMFEVKRSYLASADMLQWKDRYYELFGSSLLISTRDSFEKSIAYFYPPEIRPLVSNPSRFVMDTSPDGKHLWLGTRIGLYWYDGERGSGAVLSGKEHHQIVSEITHLSDGTTLLGGKGSVKLIRGNKYLRTYPLGISDSMRVHRIIYSGNEAWISVEGYGLLSLNLETGEVTNRKEQFGIESSYIQALFSDKDGNIWIGTRGNGVYCLQKSLLSFQMIGEGQLCEKKINGIEPLPSGELAIRSPSGLSIMNNEGEINPYYCNTGTISYGTVFVDDQPFVLTAISNSSSHKVLRSSAALELPDNKVLMTDYYRRHSHPSHQLVISQWDGQSWQWTDTYDTDFPPKATSIRSIFKDASGKIWLRSSPDSLFCIETPFERDHFTSPTLTTKRYFIPDMIRAFCDHTGTIWACGKGYIWRKRQNEEEFSIVYSDGPFFDIGMGSNGRVWIVSQNTIISVKDDEFTQHPVNGFPEIGQVETILVDERQHKLWLASRGGLYSLPMDSLLTRKLPTITPFINRILINQEEVNLRDSLDMQPGDNFLADFSAIAFFSGTPVQYRYRINQEEWNYSRNGSITFPSNEHGQFLAEIQAGLPNAEWSTSIRIQYDVIRKFWQRPIVFIFLVILIAAVAYFMARYQIKRVRRREQHQRSIQQEMYRLEQQALAAMLNPHFVFNSLNSIQQELLEEDPLLAHRHLSRFAKLIRKNMDLSSRPVVKLKEELERLSLYLDMEKLRLGERISIQIEVDDCIPVNQVEIPSMILQPYVENAIWHGILESGSAGTVKITVREAGDKLLLIRIEDDGIGIQESQRKKKQSKHTSMGMGITARRIKLFHEDSDVSIEQLTDEEGRSSGTSVSIVLPQQIQLNCDS